MMTLPAFTENALTVLGKRYLQPNETPAEMLQRVAGGHEDFYELMARMDFLPNSPTLFNKGVPDSGTYSACFVFDIPDSMEGIMDTATKAAMVQKWGGGVGYCLSDIRPKGSYIKSTHKSACGPVAVLKMLHSVSTMITQGGKRAGAQMAILHCGHPDLQEFIHCKDDDPDALNTFNISVALTDDFMSSAYLGNEPQASLLREMAQSAWRTGDPGVFFIDEVNRKNPTPWLYKINACNPCGEQPLATDESCNLGSLNLGNYITPFNAVNWTKLEHDARTATRFLDHILDTNSFPTQSITDANNLTRKIGLGVMGWADMLAILGIHYDTDEAVNLGEQIMQTIHTTAITESHKLAKEKGTYDGWQEGEDFRRNACVTTVAPTGCQTGETLIVSEIGIVRLDELGDTYGDKWQDLGIKVSQEGKTELATRFYINGKAKTKKITLSSGIVLECTPNHKYRVFKDESYDWIRADELSPLDRVATRIGGYTNTIEYPLRQLPIRSTRRGVLPKKITFPSEMSPKLALFLGMFIGNGSVHDKGIRLHFNDEHTEKIELAISLIKELFNWDSKALKEHTCTSIYLSSTSLKNWLDINGLNKNLSIDAVIPPPIRMSSVDSIEMFIAGLWMTDGSITGNTKYIDTSSFQLAQELLVCMRAIGQNGRITIYETIKGRISQKPSYRIFWKDFGSSSQVYDGTGSSRKDKDFKRKIRETYSELLWDDVVEIEDSEADTYDIEVPENNTYIANSVISHNTISLLLGASSGIEPHFAIEWTRYMYQNNERIPLVEKIPVMSRVPAGFVPKTAMEIAPEWHIKHQAAFQKWVDSGVSKTINMPESATVEDIYNAYIMMWQTGCKGGTVYRDKSRGTQVLNVEPRTSIIDEAFSLIDEAAFDIDKGSVEGLTKLEAFVDKMELQTGGVIYSPVRRKLPDERPSITHKFRVGDQEGYITVGLFEDGMPGELFISLAKDGSTMHGLLESIGILTSLCLQYGVPLDHLTHKMQGIEFEPHGFTSNKLIPQASSIVDYIFHYMRHRFLPWTLDVDTIPTESLVVNGLLCPDCGSQTVQQEGCTKCISSSCGWSRC